MGRLAFAFAAGMVATVNPCGFAMVPAYVSLLLSGSRGHRDASVAHGLRVGGVITAAFVVTFAVVGLVIRYVSDAIVDTIPWLVVVIGLVLAAAGVMVLAGRRLPVRALDVKAFHPGSAGNALFGIAFALASASCTLPIFLSVITVGATAANVVEAVAVFGAYGLGMGTVLVALAVAIATSQNAVVARLRRTGRFIERAGGWMLVASGLFVVYYWGTVLATDLDSSNPLLQPIVAVERASSWLTARITDHTLAWSIALLLAVAAIAIYEARRSHRTGAG